VAEDGEGRLLVSDYKTAGNIHNWIEGKNMLVGDKFQVPVYGLLAAAVRKTANVSTELIGLGPYFFPDRGFLHGDPPTLDTETLAALRAGLEETLLLFAIMAREGRFPMIADEHRCMYCGFRSACRRLQFASRERVRHHERFAIYFENREKSKTRPTLAEVRGKKKSKP
jgi:hypothetical protein